MRLVSVTDAPGSTDTLSADADDSPLMAPLSRTIGWAEVQRMSQSAMHRDDPLLHGIRATAVVRRGTRMVKVLSATQLAGHLNGWLPYGFCYRGRDIAHLRTPADLALLRTDGTGDTESEVAYALRWRAVDPADYEVPAGPVQKGLTGLPSHSRLGPMVLGTGFTPSSDDLIPELVTTDLADLPMPANAQLVAYTPGGDAVTLFAYQPEQHGWLRLAGPRWRHLLASLPGVSPDREYEAVADPPEEFRVRALTRAARYPVSALSRRAEQALWRGVTGWVLQRDETWTRLRVARPDADAVALLGARCYERGVYEVWAPTSELVDHRVVDFPYHL